MDTVAATPSTSTYPNVDDRAPDGVLVTADGHVTDLAGLWADAPTGLGIIFVRHFGCPFCKQHLAQIAQRTTEFDSAGVSLVALGPGTPQEAAEIKTKMHLPFPVYGDYRSRVFSDYGLSEIEGKDVVTRQSIVGSAKAVLQGHLPSRSEGNPKQLHGEFLVDREGIVRYAVRPTTMSDLPDPSDMLEVARSLTVA